MNIWNLIIPICPAILLHLFLIRKRRHLSEYDKQSILWSADFVTSVILLILAVNQYNYALKGIIILHNMWIFIIGILFVVILFLLAPSGFSILVHHQKEATMEAEEFSFNKVASVIRNFCYALLVAFALITIVTNKSSHPNPLYMQGLLGICIVVLPALCFRQAYYFIKMVTTGIPKDDFKI